MPSFFRVRNDSLLLNAAQDDQLVAIASGQGAPSGSSSLGGAACGVYIREDASTEDTVVYVTRDSGTTWKALEAGWFCQWVFPHKGFDLLFLTSLVGQVAG